MAGPAAVDVSLRASAQLLPPRLPTAPCHPPASPGANIVPAHIFETAATDAQLRRLVGDAKAAHINMLRVWGGGRYFQGAWGVPQGRGRAALGWSQEDAWQGHWLPLPAGR